ncbi:MAG: hypothetical protein ACRD3W_22915, partial [Terriglobales bacterium]
MHEPEPVHVPEPVHEPEPVPVQPEQTVEMQMAPHQSVETEGAPAPQMQMQMQIAEPEPEISAAPEPQMQMPPAEQSPTRSQADAARSHAHGHTAEPSRKANKAEKAKTSSTWKAAKQRFLEAKAEKGKHPDDDDDLAFSAQDSGTTYEEAAEPVSRMEDEEQAESPVQSFAPEAADEPRLEPIQPEPVAADVMPLPPADVMPVPPADVMPGAPEAAPPAPPPPMMAPPQEEIAQRVRRAPVVSRTAPVIELLQTAGIFSAGELTRAVAGALGDQRKAVQLIRLLGITNDELLEVAAACCTALADGRITQRQAGDVLEGMNTGLSMPESLAQAGVADGLFNLSDGGKGKKMRMWYAPSTVTPIRPRTVWENPV